MLAVNLVSIKDKSILLLLKRDVWILPGGKPETGESEFGCLEREIREELPSVSFKISSYFADFEGITPHTRENILVTVYFGEIDGDLTTASEISEAGYFTKERSENIPISEITKKIISHLSDSHLL